MREEPTILHVDLDAFFAAVEQLDAPRHRGRPVVVGGLGNRGVVSAASYEARAYGIRSAMPMARARRACPHAVFLAPRFDRYAVKSREVMDALRSVTPLVEQLSIDEAFVDVTGARRQFGTGPEIAASLRRRIRAETGLAASIGVATTKFLAKLASDLAKPDGLLVVEAGTERDFLAPLPVTRLWGVGAATHRVLERMGVVTIGDLARLPEAALAAALGPALGRHLHALARNDDPRPVVTGRAAKSVGAEETFATDLTDRETCDRELVRLADRVASRLRRGGLHARTVTIKVRFADFHTRTRARTLAEPTDVGAVIRVVARELLDDFDVTHGVRLLGVSASHLEREVARQATLALGDDPDAMHRDRVAAIERAADAIRGRFGDGAVRPAALADPHRPRSPRPEAGP